MKHPNSFSDKKLMELITKHPDAALAYIKELRASNVNLIKTRRALGVAIQKIAITSQGPCTIGSMANVIQEAFALVNKRAD